MFFYILNLFFVLKSQYRIFHCYSKILVCVFLLSKRIHCVFIRFWFSFSAYVFCFHLICCCCVCVFVWKHINFEQFLHFDGSHMGLSTRPAFKTMKHNLCHTIAIACAGGWNSLLLLFMFVVFGRLSPWDMH